MSCPVPNGASSAWSRYYRKSNSVSDIHLNSLMGESVGHARRLFVPVSRFTFSCSFEMLPRSEKQGGCLPGELGIGMLTDVLPTIQEILNEISQQPKMVCLRQVPSLQTAIVEFMSFQFGTPIFSASPSEALVSATGKTIQVSAVYFDPKSSCLCGFGSSDTSRTESRAEVSIHLQCLVHL